MHTKLLIYLTFYIQDTRCMYVNKPKINRRGIMTEEMSKNENHQEIDGKLSWQKGLDQWTFSWQSGLDLESRSVFSWIRIRLRINHGSGSGLSWEVITGFGTGQYQTGSETPKVDLMEGMDGTLTLQEFQKQFPIDPIPWSHL